MVNIQEVFRSTFERVRSILGDKTLQRNSNELQKALYARCFAIKITLFITVQSGDFLKEAFFLGRILNFFDKKGLSRL